jgi:hypothetical protein
LKFWAARGLKKRQGIHNISQTIMEPGSFNIPPPHPHSFISSPQKEIPWVEEMMVLKVSPCFLLLYSTPTYVIQTKVFSTSKD